MPGIALDNGDAKQRGGNGDGTRTAHEEPAQETEMGAQQEEKKKNSPSDIEDVCRAVNKFLFSYFIALLLTKLFRTNSTTTTQRQPGTTQQQRQYGTTSTRIGTTGTGTGDDDTTK